MSAEVIPAFGGLGSAEPNVPFVIDGWRRDTTQTLRAHRSAGLWTSPKSVPSSGAMAAFRSAGSE
jgi:hypothetical protein